MGVKLWPTRTPPDKLQILVAGCGANQAAILAHANPQHQVTGIDLSRAAIAHHQRLKRKHALSNLELHHLAVEDADQIRGRFDLVVSTGVLHHIPDPLAGLKALGACLAPDGVMSLMLYGQHGRAGVYMVQEALRELGADRNQGGLQMTKEMLGRLPEWHSARAYVSAAPDMGYAAGVVDTFLNARDRAYTVPEILSLVSAAGLHFQSWLDDLHYRPGAFLPAGSDLLNRIEVLPQEKQWNVVDLMSQRNGAHRFLVTNPLARGGIAVQPNWETAVLHQHPDLHLSLEGDGKLRLQREWHSLVLSGPSVAAVQRIDGRRTWGEVMGSIPEKGRGEVFDVLCYLGELDHLLCRSLA